MTLLWCLLALAAAGDRPAEVTWRPAEPRQGSFAVVTVRPEPGGEPVTSVTGMLAGQPLHFAPTGDGGWWAIGAVPVDTRESLPLTMTLERPGADGEHVFHRIPVRPAAFPVETLTVARRFTEPPDSALAARIAVEFAAAREVSRRSHETPRLWVGPFTRPAAGRVSSPYGVGRELNGTVQSRHTGVDLSGRRGDPVVAANRGVVALIGDFYYAGNVVYLDHGRGLVTAYLHLSAVDVAQGDTVTAGQPIGRIGATGRVTGPHLHWIARYGSVSADGLSLLELEVPESRQSAVGSRP